MARLVLAGRVNEWGSSGHRPRFKQCGASQAAKLRDSIELVLMRLARGRAATRAIHCDPWCYGDARKIVRQKPSADQVHSSPLISIRGCFPANQFEQALMTDSPGSRVRPLTAHSHTAPVRQPSSWSILTARISTSRLRAILARQNSVRVDGHLNKWQSCPCQKQPCTNSTARCFAKTISGFPGNLRSCSRKRKPFACKPFRSSISGRVSTLRMPAIIRLRTAGETTSAISRDCSAVRAFDCGGLAPAL